MNASAGCRAFELFDEATGVKFPLLVLYPSNSAERIEPIGRYALSVSMNGRVAAGEFPLVVISHGSGSSQFVFRTLAAHLARHGFVVAVPEHPGNNRNNNELADTVANLVSRPRHIRLVNDWAFSNGEFSSCLRPDFVAIVGHSMGGYTALATAGGIPTAFARETPERRSMRIEVTRDDRVKALVLLAPAAGWFFAPGALDKVRVPVLMLTPEKDEYLPKEHFEFLGQGFPDQTLIEHRTVANAGHYCFLSPFPAEMTNARFPPSQDPDGFDRERFHTEMNAEILEFLRRVSSTGSK